MQNSYFKEIYATKAEPIKFAIVKGSNMVPLTFKFMDIEVPAAGTTNIYFEKPSGMKIYNAGRIENNACVFDMTTQMSAEEGVNKGQIEVLNEGKVLYSFEIVMFVLPCRVDSSAVESQDEFTALQEALAKVAGFLPKANVEGVGSNRQPVFFDPAGVAHPVAVPLAYQHPIYVGSSGSSIDEYIESGWYYFPAAPADAPAVVGWLDVEQGADDAALQVFYSGASIWWREIGGDWTRIKTNRDPGTFFGTCTSASGTANKTVTLSDDYQLTIGDIVNVQFTSTNTANSPKLNVQNTGAKPIVLNQGAISSVAQEKRAAGVANRTLQYVYDGTSWVFIGWSMVNDVVSGDTITTTVPSGTVTSVMSVTLPPGIYLIVGHIQFTANTPVICNLQLAGTPSGNSWITRNAGDSGGGQNVVGVEVITEQRSIYLNVYQASGESKNVNMLALQAVRLQ